MPLIGTLRSMPLPDLLQWLGNSRRTGTLQIEFDKVSKSIHLKEGQVIGCSSDDPAQRLGHFLLSRGKITEEQLRQALSAHEATGKHLGATLVEMNVLSADELGKQLADKAEEIIFSMFDWNEAVFRFHEILQGTDNVFPVSLRVEDVLLRGLKRYDEMQEIRSVFNGPGIVLRKTGKRPPPQVFSNRMARTLYESADGERTVAEMLLDVHGSEYVVTKFLYELHRNGLVEIVGVKPVATGLPATSESTEAEVAPPPAADATPPPPATANAPPEEAAAAPAAPRESSAPQATPSAVTPQALPEATAAEPVEDLLADFDPDFDPDIDLPPPKPTTPVGPSRQPGTPPPVSAPLAAPSALTPAPAPPAPATPEPGHAGAVEAIENSDAHRLHSRLEAARKLMARSESEAALEILDQLYRQFPGDESLRRLTAEAEAAFIEKAYRHYLPPAKIPTLAKPIDVLESEKLSPSEFFLLSRIDGRWDVKSIIQIAPLREADAIRTLKRMRENGVIELRDPSTTRG
jgi:hypothetical protein